MEVPNEFENWEVLGHPLHLDQQDHQKKEC